MWGPTRACICWAWSGVAGLARLTSTSSAPSTRMLLFWSSSKGLDDPPSFHGQHGVSYMASPQLNDAGRDVGLPRGTPLCISPDHCGQALQDQPSKGGGHSRYLKTLHYSTLVLILPIITRHRDKNLTLVRGERRAVPGSHPEGPASEEGWGIGADEVLVQHVVQQGGDVQGGLGLLGLHLQNGLRHRSHCQQGCFTQAPPVTVPRGLSDKHPHWRVLTAAATAATAASGKAAMSSSSTSSPDTLTLNALDVSTSSSRCGSKRALCKDLISIKVRSIVDDQVLVNGLAAHKELPGLRHKGREVEVLALFSPVLFHMAFQEDCCHLPHPFRILLLEDGLD
ncbi:MAG: hypothetical protein FRX49_00129 [Trebouxia sp. A1-2]|nr:MAG: hypothetical protein FRX49_00129 [Trebouxia sp. A1-2]